MNVFALINGELHTPELNGSILPGITRRSIIELARQRGLEVVERKMAIDELLVQIANGECTEMFSCGTAAIVAPIGELSERGGETYTLPLLENSLTDALRSKLLGIQEGREVDDNQWTVPLEDKFRMLPG